MNHPPFLPLALALLTALLGCDSTVDDRRPENPAVEVDSDDGRNQRPTIQAVDSEALTYAPKELKAILEQFKPAAIEFRSVTEDGYPYEGCHWRMELNDDLLQAHIDRFDLEPTDMGPLTEKMFRDFPAGWPELSPTKLQMYAWPYNRDDGNNLQLWSVMAIDADASMLYFFYQNYDVTP